MQQVEAVTVAERVPKDISGRGCALLGMQLLPPHSPYLFAHTAPRYRQDHRRAGSFLYSMQLRANAYVRNLLLFATDSYRVSAIE